MLRSALCSTAERYRLVEARSVLPVGRRGPRPLAGPREIHPESLCAPGEAVVGLGLPRRCAPANGLAVQQRDSVMQRPRG